MTAGMGFQSEPDVGDLAGLLNNDETYAGRARIVLVIQALSLAIPLSVLFHHVANAVACCRRRLPRQLRPWDRETRQCEQESLEGSLSADNVRVMLDRMDDVDLSRLLQLLKSSSATLGIISSGTHSTLTTIFPRGRWSQIVRSMSSSSENSVKRFYNSAANVRHSANQPAPEVVSGTSVMLAEAASTAREDSEVSAASLTRRMQTFDSVMAETKVSL
eukprot:TRINITY_DN104068_c0_g1_i1.p1 TRINITY_DN104068_c0_g1~~TRINITY_DN104068_c0_g1_i1.p1  ORF type:complete len:249 (-),score=33.22 TRINITY_DN104068_c0_g1_i1:191-844(-)